jgi:hypothetical protein
MLHWEKRLRNCLNNSQNTRHVLKVLMETIGMKCEYTMCILNAEIITTLSPRFVCL